MAERIIPPAPPKVLLIVAHPEPQESVANQALLTQIGALGNVTVHDLYAKYPDFFIDVKQEQALLREYELIVFQHPLYMYSCPALLKEWIDRVLIKGFAHGKEGDALIGKHWCSVITVGGPERAYCRTGYNRYAIEEILRPFELTAALCRMQWIAPKIIYWARHLQPHILQAQVELYHRWLASPPELQPERPDIEHYARTLRATDHTASAAQPNTRSRNV